MTDEKLSPLERTVQRQIRLELSEKRRAWKYLALAFQNLMVWIAAVGAGLVVIGEVLARLIDWSSRK